MIDTHAHLYLCEKPLTKLIENAKAAGLTHIIQISTDAEACKTILKDAKTHDILHATAGIHPMYEDKFNDLPEIEKLIKENKSHIQAVGEIGLDYKYDHDKTKQTNCFRAQLELARTHNLPVLIHQRHSEEDMLTILNQNKDIPTVVHCYASDPVFAKAIERDNLFYSFTGLITYSKKGKIIKTLKELPLEKLMIETDCPYLTPKAHEGDKNEPAYVIEIAKRIAELKDIPLETVIETTTKTAKAFFAL